MIYRKLDSNEDYTFGKGGANFYKNNPDAVAQAVKTRLLLFLGEWFLDTSKGTPYNTEILGTETLPSYDQAIQEVILLTQGVLALLDYASSVDPSTRGASISCKIDTIYGRANLEVII